MTVVSNHDRECARLLPDDFVRMQRVPISAVNVIRSLIVLCWMSYPAQAKRELAEILEPILEPLTEKDATVTDELRQQCEEAVVQWIEQQ